MMRYHNMNVAALLVTLAWIAHSFQAADSILYRLYKTTAKGSGGVKRFYREE